MWCIVTDYVSYVFSFTETEKTVVVQSFLVIAATTTLGTSVTSTIILVLGTSIISVMKSNTQLQAAFAYNT